MINGTFLGTGPGGFKYYSRDGWVFQYRPDRAKDDFGREAGGALVGNICTIEVWINKIGPALGLVS